MTNDIIEFTDIVNSITDNIAELAKIGQDGFNVPLVTTSDELAKMTGLPVKPKRSLSNDLLWFYALKITICAHEMLEHSARIFQQIDDIDLAERVEGVINTLEEEFHPCETALQAYSHLLRNTTDSMQKRRQASQ